MATTWLTMLNRVFVPLGEDKIATTATELTDPYQKLVSNLANQIKQEIEEAHTWRALQQKYTVTVPINQTSTDITSPSTPNENCRLMREPETLRPLVFDQTDANNPYRLYECDMNRLLSDIELETDDSYDDIQRFSLQVAATGVPKLLTFPPCKEQRTISAWLYNPQGWIDDDAITTNIFIPVRPLLIGTLWYALEERGEELGINGIYTEERYRKALDDAIARDMAEQGGLDLVPV